MAKTPAFKGEEALFSSSRDIRLRFETLALSRRRSTQVVALYGVVLFRIAGGLLLNGD